MVNTQKAVRVRFTELNGTPHLSPYSSTFYSTIPHFSPFDAIPNLSPSCPRGKAGENPVDNKGIAEG